MSLNQKKIIIVEREIYLIRLESILGNRWNTPGFLQLKRNSPNTSKTKQNKKTKQQQIPFIAFQIEPSKTVHVSFDT